MHAADAEEGGVTHRPRPKLIPSLSLSLSHTSLSTHSLFHRGSDEIDIRIRVCNGQLLLRANFRSARINSFVTFSSVCTPSLQARTSFTSFARRKLERAI